MIDSFSGVYRFLSNFYPVPGGITIHRANCPTVEHAFQASKCFYPEDAFMIAKLHSPGDTKKLGRTIKLRDDWDKIKDGVMLSLLRAKFSEPSLFKRLFDTGDEELVEGNTWHDNYWGDCKCSTCKLPGKNKLGRLLMLVREEIQAGI